MAKYFYDLHIHSILSPCADIFMTPNNILNMAMLKNLDFVGITDHNSTKQLPILFELADSYDFIIIPGVEITVLEGFHVLCYFKSLDLAMDFGNAVENHLIDKWDNYSKEDQVLTDIYDQELSFYNKSLQATDISYLDLTKLVKKYNGLIVLAHVDRLGTSALGTYRLDEIKFDAIELQKGYLSRNKSIDKYKDYKVLINSDAHDLINISEKDNFIELKEKSIDAFFDYMVQNNE